MSELLDAVRARVSEKCLTTTCRKKRCRVNLPNKDHSFIVVDMDHAESPASNDETRCDFLFIGECNGKDWVAPVEFKGSPKARRVVRQLQAGASIADGMVPKRAEVEFKPVVVYYNGLKSADRIAFRKKPNKVTFRQQSEFVLLRERVISLELAFK